MRFLRVWALSGVILLLGLGCQTPAPPPPAVFLAQAERLHDGALMTTVVLDADLTDYLQLVGDRVAEAAHQVAPDKINDAFARSIRCQLVNCDVINAFSAGGMHVYVTTGLFRECQSEEQLAAAIAHAYAHLVNLDLEATKMKPDETGPLSMVAWNYVANRFSLEQEKQADALAQRIYLRGGWDPGKFSTLFEHLESHSGALVAPDRLPLPVRVAVLEDSLIGLSRPGRKLPVADPKTFVSLRDRSSSIHETTAPMVPELFLKAFPNCILSGDTPEQREAQERLRPVLPGPVQKLEPN